MEDMAVAHHEGPLNGAASETGPPDALHLSTDDLYRSFVRHMVAQGRALAEQKSPGASVPDVNWDEIWAAADGAGSSERSIGRVVISAYRAATDLADAPIFSPDAGTLPPAAPFRDSLVGAPPQPEAPPVATPPTPVSDVPRDDLVPVVVPASLVEDAPTTVEAPVPAAPPAPVAPVAEVPVADTEWPPPMVAAPETVVAAAPPPPPPPPPIAPGVVEPEAGDLIERADPTAPVLVPFVAVPETEGPIPADIDQQPAEQVRLPGRKERRLARSQVGVVPRWATVFGWVRNIGIIILLFVAWQLWGTAIAQHHAQSQLKTAFETSVATHKSAASTSPAKLLPATGVASQPPEGSVVGHLVIPVIGVDQYVVSGTATQDLAKGPGHYIGTALPGQVGNVAIAGHRTTDGAPFNELGHMAIGDKIELTSLTGHQFTYVVSQAPVAVSPSDTAVLSDFGDNRITLTTCNPEYSAAQRLIVVGKLVQGAVAPTATSKPVVYHVANPATASWRWNLFPIVALVLIALILLGLGNRHLRARFGRVGYWVILTPIWVAGLYFLFTTLISFLPPSI
jgi:sortase A